MNDTITIDLSLLPPMGHCHCGKEAKHKEWCEFDPPIISVINGREIKGVWHFVCDDHKKVVQ